MIPEDRPFTPEEIDEQIDRSAQVLRFSPSAAPETPEQYLIGELHAFYSAETDAMTRAIARGRARLAQSSSARLAPQPRRGRASTHPRLLQERRRPMKSLSKLFSPEQRPLYRIGSLVTVALLVVLVGGLVAGLILVRLGWSSTGTQPPDLKGGVEITLQASCNVPTNHCIPQILALMPNVTTVLKNRIKDGLGVSQPVVHQQGRDRIIVDLPPQVRTQDAVQFLGRPGKLEIIDTGPIQLPIGTVVQPRQYPVRFTGDQLDPNSIFAAIDHQSGRPIILFAFKSQYQAAFATYTRQNIGNFLTITLDGDVIESAVIQSEITDQGQIAGSNKTLADAQETAALLRYGALPVPLTIVSETTITT
jgi:uncharacterized membrane protein